jgi:hypothetical protein
MEIRDLKQSIAALPPLSSKADPRQEALTSESAQAAAAAESEGQEITRLKQLTAKLSSDITQLEQLRAENARLRTRLAAMPDRLTAEETQALEKARERAEAIACVNNLKQLGLAMRVWANDNEDSSPPDILSMTNELSTPKVLVCPTDRARLAASTWAAYNAGNCSYDFLAPSTPHMGREPQRVAFRCPIHGNITLCDGSVQQRIAKDHPEWLVKREGNLYCITPRAPNPGPTPQPAENEPSPNQQ